METYSLWAGHSGEHDELYWNMMQPGDLVIAYRDRSLVSASFLVERIRSVNLGQRAWPDATSRPFDLIYFLTKPVFFQRPIVELSQYFGEVYQGLRRASGSSDILRDFGDFESFLRLALIRASCPRNSRRL